MRMSALAATICAGGCCRCCASAGPGWGWPSAAVPRWRPRRSELLAERAAAQLLDAHDGAALSVSALRRLPGPDRRNALRYWLELRGLAMPDQRRLLEIAGPMLAARQDAQPLVEWPGGAVRRHGGCCTPCCAATLPGAHPRPPRGKPLIWDWRREPRLVLPDGAWLELREDPRGRMAPLRAAGPAHGRLSARGRHRGRSPGRPHAQARAASRVRAPPWRRRRGASGLCGPPPAGGRGLVARPRAGRRAATMRRARRCRLQLHRDGAALI